MSNTVPVMIIYPKNDMAVVCVNGVNFWLSQGYFVSPVRKIKRNGG